MYKVDEKRYVYMVPNPKHVVRRVRVDPGYSDVRSLKIGPDFVSRSGRRIASLCKQSTRLLGPTIR